MPGHNRSANASAHAAFKEHYANNFMPISNARVADYARRVPSVPGCLPGCETRTTGMSQGPSSNPLPQPSELATREDVLQRVKKAFKGKMDTMKMAILVRSLRKCSHDAQTVSRSDVTQEMLKAGLRDTVLISQFCDIFQSPTTEAGSRQIFLQDLEQELAWLFLPPSQEKFKSLLKSKIEENPNLLAGKRHAVRVRSAPPGGHVRRTVTDAWLQVEGQQPPTPVQQGTTQDEAPTIGLTEEEIALQQEELVKQAHHALREDMRKVDVVARAVTSRRVKADALEQALLDLVPQLDNVASLVAPTQPPTRNIWMLRQGAKNPPPDTQQAILSPTTRPNVPTHASPARSPVRSPVRSPARSPLASPRREPMPVGSPLPRSRSPYGRAPSEYPPPAPVLIRDHAHVPSSDGAEGVMGQQGSEGGGGGSDGSRMVPPPLALPAASQLADASEAVRQGSSAWGLHISIDEPASLRPTTPAPTRTPGGRGPRVGSTGGVGGGGVWGSRYVGDNEAEAARLSALEVVVETSEGAAKTVFDLCRWAGRWLEEMREVAMEGGEEDWVTCHARWLSALSQIAQWSPAEAAAEAEAAEEEYVKLASRTQHLILLLERTADRRAGLEPVWRGAAPELGVVLGRVLEALSGTSGVQSCDILDSDHSDPRRQQLFHTALATALLSFSDRVAPGRKPASARQAGLRRGATPRTCVSVKSDARASGIMTVDMLAPAGRDKVARLRARIEAKLVHARAFPDVYYVGGRRICVYAPSHHKRAAPIPVQPTPAVGAGAGGERRARGGGVEVLDGGASMGPSLRPSCMPLSRGFVRDLDGIDGPDAGYVDRDGFLEVTPAVGEKLELQSVVGFRGWDTRGALLLNSKLELLFFTGAVCVVRSGGALPAVDDGLGDPVGKPTMRFFRAHDGVVTCLAMAGDGGEGRHCRREWDGKLVASGQGPGPGTHHRGRGGEGERQGSAYVCVWDCITMAERARLGFYTASFDPGVVSVSFNSDGTRLAVLAGDVRHTVSVWGWEDGVMITSVSTHKYEVDMVAFNPHCKPGPVDMLVTAGKLHVRFWALFAPAAAVGSAASAGGGAGKEVGGVSSQVLVDVGKPLAVWDTSSSRLSGSKRASGISMQHAGSQAYLHMVTIPPPSSSPHIRLPWIWSQY